MTTRTHLTTGAIHRGSAGKRMLQGALVALIVILFFLIPSRAGNPEWPRFWMVRPLIIVPLAGAMGGLFYYFMDSFRFSGGWKKIMANAFSLVTYLIGLWLGIVLGLAGTLWN